ncbi:hypothetical protein Bbelb_425380 [Branchiostoma belcheri]|nr:hypothetical protein Bbelb_425380 [Branchiostoma belcheri]
MDDACPKVGSKRKRQRQYCGHCNQELGNTAYYLHKKQFFKDGVWRQAALFGGANGYGASCPIATQEHGEGDFYTEDTLDDDGLEPPDTSSAENDGFDVGEGETNGWLLSDTGSDTDSSDQGDACYEESTFCYNSVVESLQELVSKPSFQEKCEQWRERDVSGTGMTDVYDGKVWNEFQYVNGTPFLAEPNNLALMLNCDWYQPYKHSEYSVGVLYLVVLNLPREERFKEENMIVVGLIPGPKEPKIDINSFLEPLVDELQDLWKGVLLSDNSVLGAQLYRAALVCLSSDIPAARKCGGFVGHGALRGCSKCLRMFTRSRFGTKADYSGFDRTVWPLRTSSDHVRFAKMGRRAKSKAERKRVEDRYGARWSEHFRLPYYDAVRFVVIDPMHNLLLGTSKHVFKVWVDLGVLNRKAFDVIQSRIDSMKVPSDVGRIPRKIASGFSGFTADQWKNWTCIYSLFCLKGLIDSRHYDMWYEFVQACRLLCSRVISYENLLDADNHLQRFLAMFEEICGPQHCTPNMHLHLHLKECIEDYGPVYSFWCFSFERYNGMLGKYQHNNRNIEVQIMRKFQQSKQLSMMTWPGGYGEAFENVLNGRKASCTPVAQASRFLSDAMVLDNASHVEPLSPFQPTIDSRAEDRPAVLREFILVHLVLGNGRRCSHAVARVTWYQYHPERWFYGRGSPVQVWGLAFEPESSASFIPSCRVNNIHRAVNSCTHHLPAPQHTPSVRGVNFRAHARRARIRECKEISGAVHAEPGNPWTRPGHGEFHGCVRAGKLLETWVFVQCTADNGSFLQCISTSVLMRVLDLHGRGMQACVCCQELASVPNTPNEKVTSHRFDMDFIDPDDEGYNSDWDGELEPVKILVPRSMRKEMLDILHEGHLGQEKTKARARDILFWPGLNAQIDERVQRCATCQEHRRREPALIESLKDTLPLA